MNFGLDTLGLLSPRWDVDATINAWPRGWFGGCFSGAWPYAFGQNLRNVRKLLDSGKCAGWRLQAWWDYVLHHQSPHRLVPTDELAKVLKNWERLARHYQGLKFYLSISGEYKSTDAAAIQERINMVRDLAPSWIPVQNPMDTAQATVPGVLVERHGPATSAIVSHDGNASFDMDVRANIRANENGKLLMFWGGLFNMAEGVGENEEQPPPSTRNLSPDVRYIKSLVALAADYGTPPRMMGAEQFARPTLYKSHAEDSKGTDPRGNKPLIIVREHAPRANIVTSRGQLVASMPYFGTFGAGLFRYYSGSGPNLYGYEMADKAQALSGSRFVFFEVGRKVYGPVNPAFRTGYYQSA